MQIELDQLINKYKELLSKVQHELIAHQIAVDALERSNTELRREVADLNKHIATLTKKEDEE